MSDTNELADSTETEKTAHQPVKPIKLPALYQQFTHKLVALLLTLVAILGLTTLLFVEHYSQNKILVATQLVPLTQQLKQINALQNAQKLVTSLLSVANAEHFVELHTQLLNINRQLLQLNSANGQRFQQWLHDNQLAQDIVSRIQDSHTRNQQLRQSSIIQLQLMLFSITPIIDKKLSQQKILNKQLQADQAKDRVTFSRANAYANAVLQLNNLQQFKTLLAEILVNFEQLTMHTPLITFEQLRLRVEHVFVLNKQLSAGDGIKALADVHQQLTAFEKIVLTEQRALAKWQGYLRLAQDYQHDLKTQRQQISQLLLTPYQHSKVSKAPHIKAILADIGMPLSNQNITLMIIFVISLLLLFFFYLIWKLREQIKMSAQQGVEIIQRNIQNQGEAIVPANCAETEQILQQLQSIIKPAHNEQQFQLLTEQYQTTVQLIAQQKQIVAQLAIDNEQQALASKAQSAAHLSSELQRYQTLAKATLFLIQQQQGAAFKHNAVGDNVKLTELYQQITQFHLALTLKAETSVLKLCDINLEDEIHAILFNQQKKQQIHDNQLFISCDEQLLTSAKIDYRLFQQLMNLFIDISLNNCHQAQLHLQLQLQEKSTGQQLVHFVAHVKNQPSDVLPDLITQLLKSQSTDVAITPLIDIFTLLFAKQHGENIAAQLNDDGYQLSFELPLAIAGAAESTNNVSLKNTKLMLLSNNSMLAERVENMVLSAKGKFERLARIDSFEQQLTAKYLNRHPIDILVVASDMALGSFDLITQQLKNLPHSLQPKLMILQSNLLSYQHFGFYSQAEPLLCKYSFLGNINALLASDNASNQLLSGEKITNKQYVESGLSVLLAVNAPQQYQNLQRLLQWLGLQVQVVAHEAAQHACWQTGLYSLLITEFTATALVEMTSKPVVDVAVFSLTELIPQIEDHECFKHWHIGQLVKDSSLTELADALAPWLKQSQPIAGERRTENDALALTADFSESLDELVITEVATVLTENNSAAVFDFTQYLQHQGSVELALFMLDDYSQDNHQQLDSLIDAIKTKNIEQAQLSISTLALNAKILSAQELQFLCTKWSKLLTGSEIPSSLNKINTLLKSTRIALNDIDEYAETI
ncbi:MAG: hypothetical protein JKY81_12860 [Colwellia sp.]|nr:hypothetical protein [Colwellia sp.]